MTKAGLPHEKDPNSTALNNLMIKRVTYCHPLGRMSIIIKREELKFVSAQSVCICHSLEDGKFAT